MTQKNIIMRHLCDFGSITPFEAFREYGITRLASVIHDLRRDGYTVVTETETGVNRYGEPTKYARYFI